MPSDPEASASLRHPEPHRPLRLAFWAILLLCWLGGAGRAYARPPKALFYYGGLTQWLDLRYDYNGFAAADGGYTLRQQAKEKYHVGLSYALLHPKLFTGTAALEFGLSQQFATGEGQRGSGNGSSLGYELTGALWPYRSYSARFRLQSDQERVEQSNIRSYDLNTDLRSLTLAWKNRQLPVRLVLSNSQTETSGLVNDRRVERSRISLESSYQHRFLGTTHFDLRQEEQNTSFADGRSDFELNSGYTAITNRLPFGSQFRPGALISRWLRRDDRGTRPLRTTTWSETVAYSPGKALDLDLDFNRSTAVGKEQDQIRDDWRAGARHRLFKSLTTSLDLRHTDEQRLEGERVDTRGNLTFGYTKRLPGETRLHLNLSKLWAITEQDFAAARTIFAEENLTVADPDSLILLAAANIMAESIQLFDAETGLPFDLGGEYLVLPQGSQTYLFVGDSPLIDTGTRLTVTYRYEVDRHLKYGTDGLAFGASLELATLTLYTAVTRNDYRLLDGDRQFVPTPISTYRLGFDNKLAKMSWGGYYSLSDADTEERQAVDAYFRLNRRLPRGDLHLGVHDNFSTTTRMGSAAAGSSRSSINHFSVNADFRTVVFQRAKTKLFSRYTNIQSETNARNDFAVGIKLSYKLRQLLLDLNAHVRWRFADSQSTREDALFVHLRRLF
jgi:hypothetical protein